MSRNRVLREITNPRLDALTITVDALSDVDKRSNDITRAIIEYDRGEQQSDYPTLPLPSSNPEKKLKKRARSETSPDENTSPPRKRFLGIESMKDLERGVEAKIQQARNRENEWKSKGKPETIQISENEWLRVQHEDNLYQPHPQRRTKLTTVKRFDDGRMEITSRKTFETDLATAEVCEEKLQSIRLNHHTEYSETAARLVEKSTKEVDEYKAAQGITDQDVENGTITDPQKAAIKAITDKYQALCEEARKKCDKAVMDLDGNYRNRRMDTHTLVDLEQVEAKQLNSIDYQKRRIKDVESKIAKLPEEIATGKTSIREKLGKIEAELDKIERSASIHSRFPDAGADGRSTTKILNAIKATLGADHVDGVYDGLKELNKRIQHYAATQYDTLQAEVKQQERQIEEAKRTPLLGHTQQAERLQQAHQRLQTQLELPAQHMDHLDFQDHMVGLTHLSEQLRQAHEGLQTRLPQPEDPARVAQLAGLNQQARQEQLAAMTPEARLAHLSGLAHLAHQQLQADLTQLAHASQDTYQARQAGLSDQMGRVRQLYQELRTNLDQHAQGEQQTHLDQLNKQVEQAQKTLSDHEKQMKALHSNLVDTHSLFIRREIKLLEQQSLPVKLERYIFSQDAETILFYNQQLEVKQQIEEVAAQLAAAENEVNHLIEEKDKIYPNARMHLFASPAAMDPDLFKSGSMDQPGQDHTEEGEHSTKEPDELRMIVPPPLDTKDHERVWRDAMKEAADISNQTVFKNAQRGLMLARGRVRALTAEHARLKEREIILQRKAEIAKGRYDTNERREEIKRTSLYEFDKKEIDRRNGNYEKWSAHQRKLDILEINIHLLKLHARRMMHAAAMAAFMPTAPNTMQRDFQNQWNNFQSLIRNW